MQSRASAGLDAMDARLQIFAMIAAADALRRDEEVGFVIVSDERKEIVVAEFIDRHGGGLARFLDLGAFHRTAAIEHDREVHGRAARIVCAAAFHFDLHDDFARAASENAIAIRHDTQGHIGRG